MSEELMNTEVSTEEIDISSENDVEVANPQMENDSNEVEETTPTSQSEEEKPIVDVNSIAAAARRKAEAEARNMQKSIDDEYVRRFGHLSNPKTGEPIRSQADYLRALDDQEELRAKQELEENGIDPKLIDNLIANNPRIRQAEQVMAEAEKQQILNNINLDVEELGKLDPTIKSLADVPPNIIEMSMASNGVINLTSAYKILNFGKVADKKAEAITQNAINQAKGKQHLNPVNGIATPDEGVEIPSSELSLWKDMFPNKSSSELKALYNKSL